MPVGVAGKLTGRSVVSRKCAQLSCAKTTYCYCANGKGSRESNRGQRNESGFGGGVDGQAGSGHRAAAPHGWGSGSGVGATCLGRGGVAGLRRWTCCWRFAERRNAL